MGRFKSLGHAQRFLSAYELIREHFHPHQHKQMASKYRATMCYWIVKLVIVLRTGCSIAHRIACASGASYSENHIAQPDRISPNNSTSFCPVRNENPRRKRTGYHFLTLTHCAARRRSAEPFGHCFSRTPQSGGELNPSEIKSRLSKVGQTMQALIVERSPLLWSGCQDERL